MPILGWWSAAAPPEIRVAPSVRFDRSTAAGDRRPSTAPAEFAEGLEHFPSALAGFDDAVVLPGGTTALVTGADGRIWTVDTTTHAAEPLVDPPLMAYGIRSRPAIPTTSTSAPPQSYGTAAGDGTRRACTGWRCADRSVELVVHEVPATDLRDEWPVVYADDDPRAPRAAARSAAGRGARWPCATTSPSPPTARASTSPSRSTTPTPPSTTRWTRPSRSRPTAGCGATTCATGATRLVAEGFHFVNGVLCDPHPGTDREQSVLVTQTSLFRLTRFHLRGPRAGTAEVVLDGLTGMPDGIDRDAAGRVWVALFTHRGRLLTWIHAHAWVKPLVLRLPARLLLAAPRRTGVLVLEPGRAHPALRGPLPRAAADIRSRPRCPRPTGCTSRT